MTDASTTAKPTMRLRWVPKSTMQAADLKLQQAWETVHYEGKRPLGIETEWRDVPVNSCGWGGGGVMRERLIDAAVGSLEKYPGQRDEMERRMRPALAALEEELATAVSHLTSAATILNSGGLVDKAVSEVELAQEILEGLQR